MTTWDRGDNGTSGQRRDEGPSAPTTTLAIARYGERALLIDVAPGTSAEVAAHLRTTLGQRASDVVPTSHCVLVCFDQPLTPEDVARALTTRAAPPDPNSATAPLVIPVRYQGEDLDEVAHACGMSRDAVVNAHCRAEYRVEFFGFAPGFAYLSGLPSALHLPRRSEPRTSVPAGSVAIASGYASVYPRSSPGGWHLLGITDIALFDLSRTDSPSLLQPGDRVRFKPI